MTIQNLRGQIRKSYKLHDVPVPCRKSRIHVIAVDVIITIFIVRYDQRLAREIRPAGNQIPCVRDMLRVGQREDK